MDASVDSCWAVDPECRLKPDVDRVVLINRPAPLARERDQICLLLHPTEAIILGLMDGARTVRDVGQLWSELTDKSNEAGLADVIRVFERYTTGDMAAHKVLVPVGAERPDGFHRYDVSQFIVTASTVNLTDLRFRLPYTVTYLPTMFCPQRCVYCTARTAPQVEPPRERILVERMREVFTELAGIGVELILLSGGDPMARGDIFDLLAAISGSGMTALLSTKLGVDYEQCLRLKDSGVHYLQVSIDSSVPSVLDRMVGVENYHQRAFRSFDHLRRAGLEVRVNCVITPINYESLHELIDYLGALGNVTNVALTPYCRSMFSHSDDLFVSPAQLEAVRAQVNARSATWPHMGVRLTGGVDSIEDRRSRWSTRSLCTANRQGFVILPDGAVTVCEELGDHPSFIIGDLKRQSVMEVWRSDRALALIHPDQSAIPDGACKSCEQIDTCHSGLGRCWRDVVKSYGWEKPHWPDPGCPHAPAGARLG